MATFLRPLLTRLPATRPALAHISNALILKSKMSTNHSDPLSPTIFTPSLVSAIKDAWLGDIPDHVTAPNEAAFERWYAMGKSPAEKKAFDDSLRDAFLPALEALNDENYPLSTLEISDDTLENAMTAVRPLREVQGLWIEGQEAKTALALVILLDQFSRNCFREPTARGQGLVYSHYDRIARAMTRCCLPTPVGDRTTSHSSQAAAPPDGLPSLAGTAVACIANGTLNPTRTQWFLMPLMHSESLENQKLYVKLASTFRDTCAENGDEAGAEFLERGIEFGKKHLVIIERFGRFPHRNVALGRETTAEEKAFLEGGGDTFGS